MACKPKELTIRTTNGETDRTMKKKKKSCIYYIYLYIFRKDKSREKTETKRKKKKTWSEGRKDVGFTSNTAQLWHPHPKTYEFSFSLADFSEQPKINIYANEIAKIHLYKYNGSYALL